jgi:hypothetical protein
MPPPKTGGGSTGIGQLSIPRVDQLPNLPSPLVLIDWSAKARKLHKFLFTDPRAVNSSFYNFSTISSPLYTGSIYCLPSYLGEYTSLGCQQGLAGEGLAVIGAALGSVLALGINENNEKAAVGSAGRAHAHASKHAREDRTAGGEHPPHVKQRPPREMKLKTQAQSILPNVNLHSLKMYASPTGAVHMHVYVVAEYV